MKELIFRKVKCRIDFRETELVTYVTVIGKRTAMGGYPPEFKDKKKYLTRLLKAVTQ